MENIASGLTTASPTFELQERRLCWMSLRLHPYSNQQKKHNFIRFWKWNSNKEKRTVKKIIISPTTTTTEYCIMKRCVVREGNGEWRTVDDEPFLGCTVFPWIINYFAPKGGDYSRGATISNNVHRKSCTKCFALLSHHFLKMITLNKLNMDFLSVPSLFLWLIFNVLQ